MRPARIEETIAFCVSHVSADSLQAIMLHILFENTIKYVPFAFINNIRFALHKVCGTLWFDDLYQICEPCAKSLFAQSHECKQNKMAAKFLNFFCLKFQSDLKRILTRMEGT